MNEETQKLIQSARDVIDVAEKLLEEAQKPKEVLSRKERPPQPGDWIWTYRHSGVRKMQVRDGPMVFSPGPQEWYLDNRYVNYDFSKEVFVLTAPGTLKDGMWSRNPVELGMMIVREEKSALQKQRVSIKKAEIFLEAAKRGTPFEYYYRP